MVKDERDILEALKAELNFIEAGGYGRSVRTPWKPKSSFQDSLICLGFPDHLHEDCCLLMQFVPPDRRDSGVPCHHIPLNELGETVASLEEEENQARLEVTVKEWLRRRIKEIEVERAAKPQP